MIILICILVIFWALDGMSKDSVESANRDYDRFLEEQRHRERMEAEEERFNRFLESSNSRGNSYSHKITRRRIAKEGDLMYGEEETEEY